MAEDPERCSFEFDPEAWAREHESECFVDPFFDGEILTENSDGKEVWQCPHETVDGQETCMFHLSQDSNAKPNPERVADTFLDIVAGDRRALDSFGPRPARFIGAKFESLVIAAERIGDGRTIDLRYAEIGDAYWEVDTIESKRLDARGIHVQGRWDCYDVTFSGEVRFNGVEFGGEAQFNRTEFAGETWFSSTNFHDFARFEDTTFSERTYFDVVQFISRAQFNRAKFSEPTGFKNTTFDRDAEFSRTEFGGDASFSGAEFSGDAWFSRTGFTGEALFREVEFNGDAWFIGAEFDVTAQFGRTKFDKDAEFEDVKFRALLNRHTALESAGHVLFDVVDETHQDDFAELTIPFTRSDGGAVRALDRGVHRLCH